MLGLLLLVPPIRGRIARHVRRQASAWVESGSAKVTTVSGRSSRGYEAGGEEEDGPWREMGLTPLREDDSDVERRPRRVIDVEGHTVEEVEETRPERRLRS